MKKKYRLHKRNSMNAFAIIVVVIGILAILNTGYALWSSKLNIYGKVDLSLNPPKLEVVVPGVGNGRFTQHIGYLDEGFEFVSDEYNEDSLITTIRATSSLSENRDVSINFTMKNTSKSGARFTGGKVKNNETSNPGGAVTGVSAGLSATNINYGDSTIFSFSANVDKENLKSTAYFKYSISFDDNGITKYFFYTVRILPEVRSER